MSEVICFLFRFGELHLLAALVSTLLVWVLMESLFGIVDERLIGRATVRLTVRRSISPTQVLWFVLRHGMPALVALSVFCLFYR